MPHYLDNIWGDESTVRGFGDALNNNFASLVQAKAQQRQFEQKQALDAAYYALERQKQMMQAPLVKAQTANLGAETGYRTAQAEGERQRTAEQQRQDQLIQSLGPMLQQRFMQTHPPMQGATPMQPPGVGPTAPPMVQTAQLGNVLQAPPVTPNGSAAPTIENLGMSNQAQINAGLIQQAMRDPSVAARILQGNIMRPGERQFDMNTGQLGAAVPQEATPYQQGVLANRDILAAIAQQNANTREFQAENPKQSEMDKILAEARKKRAAGGGGGAKMTATNPTTNERIESTDGGQTWHPIAK